MRLNPLLKLLAIDFVEDSGLPRTKLAYEPLIEAEGYGISPLDMTSLMNGLLKWDHPNYMISEKEHFELLNWMDALYGHIIHKTPWTKAEAMDACVDDKASGYPYCKLYGPYKKQTKKVLSYDDLEKQFRDYSQLFSVTLKDECRKDGKDSRLFVPANIAMVAVGNRLFGAQNQAIADVSDSYPIKIGLQSPGAGACRLWREFYDAKGLCYQSDGAANDSHFSLAIATVIRDFRKKHLPKELHKLVDRYYDMAYCMKANARGAVVKLFGQPTGQTNTASDNSFGYLALCMLHAIRNGIAFEEFKHLTIAIMGDDMMWRTENRLFSPLELEKTFNSVGMYLESPNDGDDYLTLTFCGMHPIFREVNGKHYLLYHYGKEKLLNSFNFMKRTMTPAQRLLKLVSIATLLFGDKETFGKLSEVVFSYASTNADSLNKTDTSCLAYLNDMAQLRLHTSLESS